ncbi:MAG: hypothetical protein IJM61_06250 [Firmicutes bacterium]|nr:hypothetical protein [Bacillota bacterium]
MKRFRILAATLLLIVLGTSAAFADITPIPVLLVRSGALYVIIAIIVLIIALFLLRRSVRKRSMMIDGNESEEPDDNKVN